MSSYTKCINNIQEIETFLFLQGEGGGVGVGGSGGGGSGGGGGGGGPVSHRGRADRWGDIYANMPVKKMVALYDYDPQELSPNVDAEVSDLYN